MTPAQRLDDIELGALADGELDDEAAGSAHASLAADEAGRASVTWLNNLQRQLHQSYDGVLTEKIPERTQRLLRPSARLAFNASYRRFAALAAVALIAALGGYMVALQRSGGDDGETKLARLALGAHQVFASEIEHPVEVNGTDGANLSKWLSKRLGINFSAPVIAETGFKLIGGRLLVAGDKPAALLMYEDDSGRRVSLFVEKWPSAGETSMRLALSGHLSAYYWIDSPFACAVSGDLSGEELRSVAQGIYSALAKA